jgi:hypothetical protein
VSDAPFIDSAYADFQWQFGLTSTTPDNLEPKPPKPHLTLLGDSIFDNAAQGSQRPWTCSMM